MFEAMGSMHDHASGSGTSGRLAPSEVAIGVYVQMCGPLLSRISEYKSWQPSQIAHHALQFHEAGLIRNREFATKLFCRKRNLRPVLF